MLFRTMLLFQDIQYEHFPLVFQFAAVLINIVLKSNTVIMVVVV